ncbi:DUF6152 family protein [Variovorax sp. PAMC 28711]|uniref:DUF6152 family protein n=1 Tax=Variovorax sp. PAMC 28711 TaxID=1795631 RepID=UPI00078C8523|nr:DUF6152 family protein [Variovorax sp. PAMC 28711]AMM26205.1 hypothetical protein AX767_19015 [Variovorax sp. PAMC 28711]
MKRRHLVLAAASVPALASPAWAHHGWSSFDTDRPVWLEGQVVKSTWRNPHAELVIEVPSNLRVPADIAQRPVPAQSGPVDGKALLAKAVVPTRKDRRWELELAPLTRMEAWKVAEIAPGAAVSVLGFVFKEEKGEAVMRVEYLYVDGKAYGLRSSPA